MPTPSVRPALPARAPYAPAPPAPLAPLSPTGPAFASTNPPPPLTAQSGAPCRRGFLSALPRASPFALSHGDLLQETD